MRRVLVWAVIVFQLGVLAYMAGSREYILRAGETLFLRTAPVDPRDLFRGDFVRLGFELSTVDESDWRDGLLESPPQRGDRVYALLKRGADNLARLRYLSDDAGTQTPFLRGRVRRVRAHSVEVKYGIEQLFVEQGTGIDIEKRRGFRDTLQIPMEVEVAIGGNGTGIIKGYRWSKLGMHLEVTRLARRQPGTDRGEVEGPLSPSVKLTLKNVSDEVLALVDPGEHCGFTLEPAAGTHRAFEPAYTGCRGVQPGDADVVVLSPEAEYSVELDLTEPRWHVLADGAAAEIGAVADWERFRIVYRSPETKHIGMIREAHLVWSGHLPSRAFNAFGRVD